jgi:prephenate dehydratase
MARIRKVDYFYTKITDRPGTGGKALKALKKHKVGLLALTAFPTVGGTQMDFVPDDSRRFLAAVKALGWNVSQKKSGFLVQGKDKTGALIGVMSKLGKSGINVTAITAVTGGKRRFGALFWVKAANLAKAARVLGAR